MRRAYADEANLLSGRSSDDAAARELAALNRVRRLSYLLDTSFRIPGTRTRAGLDAVIGLIPGVGDVAGAVISVYLVAEAARLGIPRSTIARMLGNVALEALVGSVPLAGDIFDVFFRANRRNVRLLERALERDRGGPAKRILNKLLRGSRV